ncbi:MAG: DNA replication and repair protein RecF [Nitrospinaceae bacterium]|nr:DNA replication and repair protein RecF [Nitrospinaceae bacterium]MBT3433780.1 DNA replication and repair protein RecF [Nitrospinaceae bacterium]MBT3820970.1 DNA replication and repair protein RecF [Nitrospinaceae bacterium]MBT4092959.1 DNA replication and repair protein RecF [Nitrospinaceae bacterium]MBT4429315.1 DNA replication and repair protein RecF [Nitrospinaceae bacterium]
MFLEKITLHNFRNYPSIQIEPDRHFNYIYGSNGAGKTNFLEAIFFLVNLQSFRRVARVKLRSFGEQDMYIKGEFRKGEGNNKVILEAAISGSERSYKFNGKKELDLLPYLDQVHAVVFYPESVQLIKGSPTLRRMVFDRAIASEERAHLSDLREYGRLLIERNGILKQRGDSDMIKVWGKRLLRIAPRIIIRRHLYLRNLRQLLLDLEIKLETKKEFEVTYRSGHNRSAGEDWSDRLGDGDQGELEMRALGFLEENLKAVEGNEILRGRTLWGPHLDDFEFKMKSRNAKETASQGEQRLLTILLAVGASESYKQQKGEAPIILLDDLSSELDEERRRKIIDYLKYIKAQVFITSTEKPGPEEIKHQGQHFFIKNGVVVK